MEKDIVVWAPAVKIATAAALLTVCLAATSQVAQAQTTYYRNSPGQSGATERSYRYGTWASSSFAGWGYLQSNADEETAYASWKYTSGGFQCSKGLASLPAEDGPDQLWYANIHQMSYTGGKGEATFAKQLFVHSIASGSQIWTGVQGWLDGIEYYVVENLDRGSLPVPASSKVGSVTIDGGVYDLYTLPRTAVEKKTAPDGTITNVTHNWRQWWSVRRVPRDSGTVNYVKHFFAWRGMTVDDKGATIPGITDLVNTAGANKLGDPMLFSVRLGVETYGPSDASIYWSKSTITKPYN